MSRKTKTLGEKYARRVKDLLEMIYRAIKFYNYPVSDEEFSWIRSEIARLISRTSRESGIRALRNILDMVPSSRSSISDRRVLELEGVVRKLQSQLSDFLETDEEFKPNETEERPKADVSAANTVFIIMPFDEEFKDVWNSGIVRAANSEGFNPVRVDMIDRSSNITDDIVESVEKCHLAIVDVTGNNPNVMFELGYAIAREKPHIIISQSTEYLPFDIRQIRTIVYSNTWSGIEELCKKIQDFFKDFKKTKNKKTKEAPEKKQNKLYFEPTGSQRP